LSYQPWKSVDWFGLCANLRKWLKKKKMKKQGHEHFISRVRGGGTPVGGKMKFRALVDQVDVMNHGNFHLQRMNSL
jgi:hypothetical protein